jgi:hypothetical protein
LLGAYFNQDFDLFGNSIEDLTDLYIFESDGATRRRVLRDIETFRSKHAGDFEEAYRREFREEIDWGISHEAFLGKVERLIHDSL